MKKLLTILLVLTPMLIGLPLLGVWLSGGDVGSYLQFPPETMAVEQPGFSPVAFGLMALGILAVLAPFCLRAAQKRRGGERSAPMTRFPWWGWAGVALGVAAWVVAWTRLPWFAPIQLHTFTPLWMAYIVVVNALTWRRSGTCMMLNRPLEFLLLFPLSALFWWFFEYLNRFVQNWYYVGGVIDGMSAAEYVVFATIPFATVLPAVLGTREYLATWPLFNRAFGDWVRVAGGRRRGWAVGMLVVSAAGLAGIGLRPDLLFPLLWVSPLLIIVSVQSWRGEATLLDELGRGDWSGVVTAALAALICGFFWEMWNLLSMAKWIYAIPYVHAGPVFEMPILGYAGYLPFGLECLVIGEWARRRAAPACMARERMNREVSDTSCESSSAHRAARQANSGEMEERTALTLTP